MDRRSALSVELKRCEKELFYLGASDSPLSEERKLIISTGDISDVDGFYALARYARSGADVLFIMNYPAYLGIKNGVSPIENALGQGYVYDTKTMLDATEKKIRSIQGGPPLSELRGIEKETRQKQERRISAYYHIMEKYRVSQKSSEPDPDAPINLAQAFKNVLSDVGFHMATKVWSEVQDSKKGELYFCIGGINSVNPFSSNSIKNEVFIYSEYLDHMIKLKGVEETDCSRSDGTHLTRGIDSLLENYENIFMDFNGSMAFYNRQWESLLSSIIAQNKFKGVYAMGGVYADKPPETMPPVTGSLNRVSWATMNQLYHPERTASFLDDMSLHDVLLCFVANNDVIELSKKEMDSNSWLNFAKANNVHTPSLESYSRCYYEFAKAKLFDFYTAVALCEAVEGKNIRKMKKSYFYEKVYGSALIAPRTLTLESASKQYIQLCQKREFSDQGIVDNIKRECVILEALDMKRIDIYTFQFQMDVATNQLSVILDSVELGNHSYLDNPPLEQVVWFEHGSAALIGQVSELLKNQRFTAKNGRLIIGNPPPDPYSEKYRTDLQKAYPDANKRDIANMADILTYNTWRRHVEENMYLKAHKKIDILRDTITQWKILNDWYDNLDPIYAIKKKKSDSDRNWGIMIQSIDFFGSNIGFIKFQAFVYNRESLDNGRTLQQSLSPGICFMRSAAVAILMVLIDESGNKYTILTRQSRVPAGIGRFLEIPAGMMDEQNDFFGVVLKEVKEETGFELKKDDVFCLTDWMYKGKIGGMYPSSGGCNEFIKLYVWEKKFSNAKIEETRSKIDQIAFGEKKEGEFITLKLIKLDDIYKEAPDAKALCSMALYTKLNEWREANPGSKYPYLKS